MNLSKTISFVLALLVIGLCAWGIRAMVHKEKPAVAGKPIVPEKVESFVAPDGKAMEKLTIKTIDTKDDPNKTQEIVVPQGAKLVTRELRSDSTGEMASTRARYDELIKGGMTPEQANEAISKSISDSLSKQTGKRVNLRVNMGGGTTKSEK